MKTQFIQATSSPHAMSAETNNRCFTVFNDGIDATEVQERLDWKALRDMITVDTSILDFMPTGQHQVAALANLGAELVQEVKAYRPAFVWKSSPAEIVGALIEEMAAPTAVAAPKVAADERTQEPMAVVYPPDGTVSPFTVINLGHGLVKMGDSLHDGRLPALWFGTDGLGIGIAEKMNREAKDGETLAVVTFANVEGLDVLSEVVQRIRSVAFPSAPVQPVAVPDGWKLVPIEPTDQMVLSPGAIHTAGKVARIHRDVWKRMLEAAPAAPAAQGDAKDIHCYDCDDGLVYADGDTEPCRACEKGDLLSLEAKAKEIYETWQQQPQFVAWKHGGNSHMQDRARDMARIAIAASKAGA